MDPPGFDKAMQIPVKEKHIDEKFFGIHQQAVLVSDEAEPISRRHDEFFYVGCDCVFNITLIVIVRFFYVPTLFLLTFSVPHSLY